MKRTDSIDDIKIMRKIVNELTSHGGRKVGSGGHEKAMRYISQMISSLRLLSLNGESYEVKYDTETLSHVLTNVAGVIQGTEPGLPPILIGAHYDTYEDYPGADDNASAVAINVLLAYKLKAFNLKRNVIFAFFDAEEPPYFLSRFMGSYLFLERALHEFPAAALILDMVGHDVPIKGLEDLLIVTGMESNSAFENILWNTPSEEGLKVIPTLNEYVGDMSDHWAFRKSGIPYLFFTCGITEDYHKPTDTPEKLNFSKMKLISDYLLNIILKFDSTEISKDSSFYDTTSTELAFIKHALKDIPIDINALKNRDDISEVVKTVFKSISL